MTRTTPFTSGAGAAGSAIASPGKDAWLIPLRRSTRPRLRLVCLPYAGGSAGAYRPFVERLPLDVELWAAQLPGRPPRMREPALTRFAPMLDGLEAALGALLDRPVALLGHSMGSMLAFELAHRIEATGVRSLRAVFVSGRGLPAPGHGGVWLHRLDDEALLAKLTELGGLPKEIRAEKELLALLLPLVRADLEALETWTPTDGPLASPIVAMGGRGDLVSEADLDAWRCKTKGPFILKMFEGDHFFIQSSVDQVVGLVTKTILTLTS